MNGCPFPCHTTVHAGPHTAVRRVELSSSEQLGKPERGEVGIGQGERQSGCGGEVPRAVRSLNRTNGKIFPHTPSDELRIPHWAAFPLFP